MAAQRRRDPAPIRMLKPIADAVGGDLEVLLDGGMRRGSNVVKALCLRARAVLIGRAYLWALPPTGSRRRKHAQHPARRHPLGRR
jgi:isopentenyl diphosphate isomerase/L-lactate dehydrogenase-like FMN-dependent dehydrogenase